MAVTLELSITKNSVDVNNFTADVTVSVRASWTNGEYNLSSGGQTHPGTLDISGGGESWYYTFTAYLNPNRTATGSQVLCSKNITVKGLDSMSVLLNAKASYTSGTSSGYITASASDIITSIPASSTLGVSTVGELGKAETITVKQQSGGTTHTITWVCGAENGTICYQSSVTQFTWTPPLELARLYTRSTSVLITLNINTYFMGTFVGSTSIIVDRKIPDSVIPSVDIAIIENTTHKATYGKYIRGLSEITITLTPTSAYDSPIISYKTTLEGNTFTDPTFTKVVTWGSSTVSATVKDMRGRTSDTATLKYDAYYYTRPQITSISVHRCDSTGVEDEFGEYAIVKFSASVHDLGGHNSAIYTLNYKKSAEGFYTSTELSAIRGNHAVTDYAHIFAADTGSSYDVQIHVEDDFFDHEKNTSVSTATTLMHWKASGLGMGIGKMAELDNVFDIGWQTRFTGGTLPVVLIPDTDLNTLTTPNTYVGEDILFNRYLNTPIDDGAFSLEIISIGDGQLKQRFSNDTRVFERFYTEGAWGSWVCTSDYHGTLLWEGNEVMGGQDVITLAEPISKQNAGIVLVFCESGQFYRKQCRFIPKLAVALDANEQNGSTGHVFQFVSYDMTCFGNKFLHIEDARIQGAAINDTTGTSDCGITYTNNKFKLCYVIGV